MSVPKSLGERGDDARDAFGVGACVLGRTAPCVHQLLGGDDAALRDERDERDPCDLAVAGGQVEHPAAVGTGDLVGEVDVAELEQRSDGRPPARVVVVAGEDDHVRAGVGEVEQGPVDDAFGLGRGGAGVELVPGDEDQVDVAVVRDAGDLGEHGTVLVGARPSADGAADVPVGGVEDAHRPEAT